MGKKDELCDFECGMVVAAGVSTSEPAELLWLSHTTISTLLGDGLKKRKYPDPNDSSLSEKAVLMTVSEENSQTALSSRRQR